MSELTLVQSAPDGVTAVPALTEAERGDVEALAGLLAKAIDRNGYGKYREQLSGGIAREAAEARQIPVDRLEWRHLASVEVEEGEVAALTAWGDVMRAAREELSSGHRAAMVCMGSDAMPMDRARFLVLRESFAAEWSPVNGIEWALVDQMCQAATAQSYWTEVLTQRTQNTAAQDLRDRTKLSQQEQWFKFGEYLPERVSEAESMQTAMGMVDRWNRVFLRCLRQLRDLRRFNVVIQNAGQVNVGQQQVNVSKPKEVLAGKQRAKKRRTATAKSE